MKGVPRFTNNFKPFGNGPWPCLNPVCKDFRKLVIRSCEITTQQYNNFVPLGTFACCCGFVYTKISSDQSFQRRFRYLSVKNYGHIWNNTLKILWKDTSVNLRQITEKLCATFETIKFRAGLLGLKFPRIGPHGSVVQETQQMLDRLMQHKRNNSIDVELRRRRDHRKKWLDNWKKNPGAGRRELMRLSPGAHSWLFAYDREWLRQHQSAPRKRGSAKADWSGLDAQFANQVRISSHRIKSLPGRPVRVTRTRIVREIRSQKDLIIFHRNELNKSFLKSVPFTSQALAEVNEHIIAYYLRKITWAADCFRQEGVLPSLSSLARRASIKCGKWDLPKVKDALQIALESLQPNSESNIKAA